MPALAVVLIRGRVVECTRAREVVPTQGPAAVCIQVQAVVPIRARAEDFTLVQEVVPTQVLVVVCTLDLEVASTQARVEGFIPDPEEVCIRAQIRILIWPLIPLGRYL